MTNKFSENLGSDLSKTRLGYYIDQLEKIEKAYLNKRFEKIGITLSQFRVLNWLWRNGEMSQKEIHKLINITPSTLNSTLNILIRKELVIRSFDENDARIRKISLTEKAMEIEDQVWDIVLSFDKRIRLILSEEEYNTTVISLGKILDDLKSDL